MTTAAAAAYCGFKTTGALRKARLEHRVVPYGRRGGRGTWIWRREDLDAFLRGDPPATVPGLERSGAPLDGGVHEYEVEGLEVGERKLDRNRAHPAGGVAAEGRRPRGPRSRDRRADRPAEGRVESVDDEQQGRGPSMASD